MATVQRILPKITSVLGLPPVDVGISSYDGRKPGYENTTMQEPSLLGRKVRKNFLRTEITREKAEKNKFNS